MDKFFAHVFFALSLAIICMPAGAAEPETVNGLNAEFFSDKNLGTLVDQRIEPNVDVHWSHGKATPKLAADHFSVRWTGWIKAPVAGSYRMTLLGNDGFRLYVDGKSVIDDWHGGRRHQSATVALTGNPQTIRIEYFEIDESAWIGLWWQPLGARTPSIVPSEVLFPDEKSANSSTRKRRPQPRHGLVADYFDMRLKRHYGRSIVYETAAMWAEWSPLPGGPVNGIARYTGFIVPPKTGRYELVAYADDRVRVSIDGDPVLEANFGRERGRGKAFVNLTANTAHAIAIEFIDSRAWGSNCQMLCLRVAGSGGGFFGWTVF